MKYRPGQEWNIALGNQWNLCHKFSGLETNICAGVCPEYITQVVATTRSLWGCVGLTVPALPPSARHLFPTPHTMYLVGTYSVTRCHGVPLSQSITSCLVCLLSTGYGPRPDYRWTFTNHNKFTPLVRPCDFDIPYFCPTRTSST